MNEPCDVPPATAATSLDLSALKIERRAPNSSAQRRRWRHWHLAAMLLALVAAGAGLQKAWSWARTLARPEVHTVEVRLAGPAQDAIELNATGYVVPRVQAVVAVSRPGRVAALHVHRGQRVHAGQVLLELDAADTRAALRTARLRAKAARARADVAGARAQTLERQARRASALAERGAAPAAQAEDLALEQATALLQLRAAEAELAVVRAQVGELELTLRQARLVSPIDGNVLNQLPQVGERVGELTPDGLPAAAIAVADLHSLQIEADVPEARIHLVRIGEACEIVLDAYPERHLRGRTLSIAPRLDRAKAAARVTIALIDATDGVLPDMAARVSFLSKLLTAAQMVAPSTPVLPAAALTQRQGKPVVFVLEGERAHLRPVELGPRVAGGYELRSGPAPGTKLVTAPGPQLRDGQPVRQGRRR